MKAQALIILLFAFVVIVDSALLPSKVIEYKLPDGTPKPPPAYMVDNTRNTHHAAPDKGTINGAIDTFRELIELHENSLAFMGSNESSVPLEERQSGSYWYLNAPHGISPRAPSGYTVFRNVRDPKYGATGNGQTDDTVAINKAITDGNRCDQNCGATTVTYAVIYFPPGTYLISAPLIQYYYTQFIGDASNRPIIKGAANFQGIALVDNDVYIPGGNGNEWYINQNQFYRTIKNFVFDLTAMPNAITQNGQNYVPTGIHWQVAQATSLQYIDFNMPVGGSTTAVGIFMENGSGGFVSNLNFNGGNIGFRAGSQQFTARGLTFTNCLTAISMVWDWGFTWQQITVINTYVAIDCQSYGGADGQGTGSISVVDSSFKHVPYAIPYSSSGFVPNIVLDNLSLYQVPQVVLISGQSSSILAGPSISSTSTQIVQSWAQGTRYSSTSNTQSNTAGNLSPAPSKPAALLNSNGQWFTRGKPTYAGAAPSVFATTAGCKNDGTGDQTTCINNLLASNTGKTIFFPAGIYNVLGTVKIPVNSIIVGEAWSQIQGSGSYFSDPNNPRVMVQVGNAGDTGIVELSELLFTVQGATAGAILMEWNVKQSTEGSAAMWDCHFRVGGAQGSNLQASQCPKTQTTPNAGCIAASMLLHVTSTASGYFENVWAWVADHDIDSGPGQTQISIYSARGILVESQGPTWFYGSASEHNAFYQYQFYKASNLYLGHMQTETPYYQPNPTAPAPFQRGSFPADPCWDSCTSATCQEAWALRIVQSSNIFIYSAGFYNFFNYYSQTCVAGDTCQQRLIDTTQTIGLWLYNLFTKGAVEAISSEGFPVIYSSNNKLGYTSEISAYLSLATGRVALGTLPCGLAYKNCRKRPS